MRRPGAPTWRSGIPLAIGAVVLTLLLVEVGFRLYFATRVGPDVLLYGIIPTREQVASEKNTVTEHTNLQDAGYMKYFPNQQRRDTDKLTGETFDVRINNRGFRGRDFEQDKPPGVIRIVTLGASSTFGYYDRDHETYPFYLEELLNNASGCQARFEVINLAIPHLTTWEIVPLFVEEALPLDPDIVTFYEGINDAGTSLARAPGASASTDTRLRERMKYIPFVRAVYRQMKNRLLLVQYLDQARKQSEFAQSYTEDEVREMASAKVDRFLGNVAEINRIGKEYQIRLIVANQQAHPGIRSRGERRDVTYGEEVEELERRLGSGETLKWVEGVFLQHNAMMQALESWAEAEGVQFVDVIGALDQDRDVLLSWVHLTPKGNRTIAAALAEAILSDICDANAVVSGDS